MVQFAKFAAVAVAVLIASAVECLAPNPAVAQWLVTPPLDSPPAAQRPPEGYRGQQQPRQSPGDANAAPQDGQDGEGNAAAPPAGCPYQERKLELLV